MGWLRLVGSFKLWFSFAEYSLFYRALLQTRHRILRSLLIVATPNVCITSKIAAALYFCLHVSLSYMTKFCAYMTIWPSVLSRVWWIRVSLVVVNLNPINDTYIYIYMYVYVFIIRKFVATPYLCLSVSTTYMTIFSAYMSIYRHDWVLCIHVYVWIHMMCT